VHGGIVAARPGSREEVELWLGRRFVGGTVVVGRRPGDRWRARDRNVGP
jgi:hypothetical protein